MSTLQSFVDFVYTFKEIMQSQLHDNANINIQPAVSHNITTLLNLFILFLFIMYKNKDVNYVTLFMFWVSMVTFQSLTVTPPEKKIHQ